MLGNHRWHRIHQLSVLGCRESLGGIMRTLRKTPFKILGWLCCSLKTKVTSLPMNLRTLAGGCRCCMEIFFVWTCVGAMQVLPWLLGCCYFGWFDCSQSWCFSNFETSLIARFNPDIFSSSDRFGRSGALDEKVTLFEIMGLLQWIISQQICLELVLQIRFRRSLRMLSVVGQAGVANKPCKIFHLSLHKCLKRWKMWKLKTAEPNWADHAWRLEAKMKLSLRSQKSRLPGAPCGTLWTFLENEASGNLLQD